MFKVLVVGDSCKDKFIYCDASRLAPDFPVPVLNVSYQTENPGMAQNVRRNIASILGECDIVTNSDWELVTKTRYVHELTNHMFFRVDSSNPQDKFNNTIDYKQYDIIVVSDYDKGYLSAEDIQQICGSHPRVFLDTKKKIGSWASDAFIIKINDAEYKASQPYEPSIGSKIIHTMGAKGAEYQGVVYPVEAAEVQDLSGAGDTFMAALVAQYLRSNDIINSIAYANALASESVRHRGVVSVR